MVEEPAVGRVFRAERRVRLSDADPAGRLRFDAAARYLHDVSNADTRDSGLADDGSWVVRRTVVRVEQPVRLFERLALATWCSGTGSRWAERRVSIGGSKGGRIEAAALWVYVDVASMVPKRLHEGFLALYGEAAGGRTVGSKLVLPGVRGAHQRRPWPLRRTDLDVLEHVNNAGYWAAVEEVAPPDLLAGPVEATIEYAKPIAPDADVTLLVEASDGSVTLWFEVAGTPHATANLTPLAFRG